MNNINSFIKIIGLNDAELELIMMGDFRLQW